MTSRDILETEAKALLGEAIGTLETIAQSATPIDQIGLVIRKLGQIDELLGRLP